MEVELLGTMAMIIITCLIISAVMKNSWIGLASGLMAGGAILFSIILLSQGGGDSWQKRGD